ncbi:MAG TPA: serine hydrolase domain-containing protein, partial [Pseudonocardiaceae bacterium]|nr:serine hydrolase domain-containing protein [Pseudonocardiaceae bacterium]
PEQVRVNAADLSAGVSALARAHQVPGGQLAVHHCGETVAVEFGELRYGSGQRVTREAAFPIGSISKTFTATLAMILVADGDLELDAALGEYLPELDRPVGELTLRHLLSHTSGFASDVAADEPTTSIRRYVLDHCGPQNLVFSPGAGFSYSNIGYVLAGHLLEVITGMSWWGAMESVLLQPLGIDPAFIVGSGLGSGRLGPGARAQASGHSVNPAASRIRPVDQSLTQSRSPAGALAVSAVDLIALGLTQLPGRADMLLPSAYAEQMRRPVPGAEPFGLADGWGLGLALFQHPASQHEACQWVGHDGNSDGTACALRVDPQSGCVIAFTSNASTGIAMWRDLVPELAKMGLPISNYSTAEVLTRSALPPVDCQGSYLNGDSEYCVRAQQNGQFVLLIDGDPVARLSFYDDLIFSQRDLESGEWGHAGRFLRNPATGDIDRIQVDGRLACRRTAPPDEDGRCLSLTGVLSP